MTRTPDDIKRGIITCMELNMEHFMPGATQKALGDALALIQQLQAQNAQQARCIENMTDKLNAMNDEVAKLQAERDALSEELKSAHSCFACKKFRRNGGECCGGSVCMMRDFEWRGVEKEESDDGKE